MKRPEPVAPVGERAPDFSEALGYYQPRFPDYSWQKETGRKERQCSTGISEGEANEPKKCNIFTCMNVLHTRVSIWKIHAYIESALTGTYIVNNNTNHNENILYCPYNKPQLQLLLPV